MYHRFSFLRYCVLAIVAVALMSSQASAAWSIGEPIIMYWEYWPVPVNPTTVQHALDGGYNVMHVRSLSDLNYIQQFGLRGMMHVDDWSALTAEMVETYAAHPAMYSYYLADEFGAGQYPALAQTMAFLQEHDPDQMEYLSIGAFNTSWPEYPEYVDNYLDTLNPKLLSYNHYQFYSTQDTGNYFNNLAVIRERALGAGIPFLNTVQGSAWFNGWRVPNEGELRFLNYTTLAYGAQGISYWTYWTPYGENDGGIGPESDGSPTQVYTDLSGIHPEFLSIATEVQPLQSVGAYHLGDQPRGTVRGLPGDSPFTISPGVPDSFLASGDPVEGMLMGLFGPDDLASNATHALVVNLDYTSTLETTVTGPDDLVIFDAAAGVWTQTNSHSATVTLAPGGGVLVAVPIDGDINGDFMVGGYDGTQILANWGMAGADRTDGDLDGDGTVDGTDFTELLSNWGANGPVEPRPGDVDGDGFVGGADASRLISNWGMTGTRAHRSYGDLNRDGTVDGLDYTEILAYWGTGTLPSEPGGDVPEPSTLLILVGAALAGLIRRR